MSPLRALALLAAAALAVPQAQAQPRERPPSAREAAPRLLPARDAAATYRTLGEPGGPRELRAAWRAADRRLRVDAPGAPGPVLADAGSGRAVLVLAAQGLVVEVPEVSEAIRRVLRPGGARLARLGADRVAELPCTVWRATDATGEGRVCLTTDGLLLRAVDGRGRGIEAVRAGFAAQDPALFREPPGARTFSLPAAAVAGLLGGGGGLPALGLLAGPPPGPAAGPMAGPGAGAPAGRR